MVRASKGGYEAGLVGAGPARERVAIATRRDARDFYCSGVRCSESETRCNGGAFRDRSSRPWALSFGHPWPNRSLQAPPLPRSLGSGTATGQLHPFRESARTFQFSKEPRDRVCPSRTVFGQGRPNAEPTGMYSWRVLDGHTRSRGGLSGEKSLWNPAGRLHRPFAGRARSHKGLTQTRVPSGGNHMR